jgi:hypothetical protein
MNRHRLSSAVLLGLGIAVVASSAAFSQSTPLKEIHVDRSCKISQEESSALSGLTETEIENDHAICHLESVLTSNHIQESLRNGVVLKSKVFVNEQEYLLQNITASPVTFVIEHTLAEGWKVDSDPQPIKVVEHKAFFQVNAEPGQIVRLHVGEHHAEPID